MAGVWKLETFMHVHDLLEFMNSKNLAAENFKIVFTDDNNQWHLFYHEWEAG